MVARTAGRKGRPYRRFRIQVLQTYGPVCHLCDGVIDTGIEDPNDPWAYVVDHDPPLALGGAPLNLRTARPAHRYCNEVRGIKPVRVARALLAGRKGVKARTTAKGKAKALTSRYTRRTSVAW